MALLLAAAALALPALAADAPANVALAGPSQVLFQNDLSLNSTNSSSFILLSTPSNVANASAACDQFSEALAPTASLTSDLQLQLSYLYSQGDIKDDKFWIAGDGDTNETCSAYSLSRGDRLNLSCADTHPAICSQSVKGSGVVDLVTMKPEVVPSVHNMVTVTSGNLTITGYRDQKGFRFPGIPYANPPVRFAFPEPYTGPAQLNALAPGNFCLQGPGGSEDCLFLNVWTQRIGMREDSPRVPVYVYVHGGGFVGGLGSDPTLDGGNLASRGDIVVVTLNYRLGLLGFGATAGGAMPGNMGLADQIMALRWVQEHIADFGGDPNHVVLGGQSAGAKSVMALMASSSAEGLFHAAIQESMQAGTPFATPSVYTDYINPAVSQATGCKLDDEQEFVTCLRGLNASMLVAPEFTNVVYAAAYPAGTAFAEMSIPQSSVQPFLPVAGNKGSEGVIDDQILYLIGNHSLPNPVPLLTGTVRSEAMDFMIGTTLPTILPNTDENYEMAMNLALPNMTDLAKPGTAQAASDSGLFQRDPSFDDTVRLTATKALTLYNWRCPLQDTMSRAFDQGTFPQSFMYMFNKAPPTATLYCNTTEVCHLSELALIFSSGTLPADPNDAVNPLAYRSYVMDTWISFITRFDPNVDPSYLATRGRGYETTAATVKNSPGFPPFNPHSGASVRIFDTQPSVQGLLNTTECDVFAKSGGYSYQRIDNGGHPARQMPVAAPPPAPAKRSPTPQPPRRRVRRARQV